MVGDGGQEPGKRNSDLLRAFRRTGDRQLRDRIIRDNLGLAHTLACRYRGRGTDLEDLRQIAVIGLVKAVDRFDPDRGSKFSSFATPTILGELRRHFRDVEWTVRVPRRLQELRRHADAAARVLEQRLGRHPTIDEIARHLEVASDEVVLALDGIRSCYRPDALDTLVTDIEDEERSFSRADNRVVVQDLLETLPERECRIVALRYWDNLTQRQIADAVGVSQMHVSRLLRRALERGRRHLSPRNRSRPEPVGG